MNFRKKINFQALIKIFTILFLTYSFPLIVITFTFQTLITIVSILLILLTNLLYQFYNILLFY